MSYVRSWARTLFLAPLVLLSFSYSAHAAGTYLETFDSEPLNWATASDAWAATSDGRYANATTAPYRAIAFFSDRRWTTDFLYTLRMHSNLRGSGNHKVGAVFNYVDDMNYHEVAIDMRGDEPTIHNVQVNRVSGGQRTTLATGHSDIPVKDTWFDVAIMRIGNNRVRVRISIEGIGKDVLEFASLTSPPAGYIGVLTQYNNGRFDDVKITPMFFRAGFGPEVKIWQNTEECVAGQKHQFDLIGEESATGTVWPPAFWGAPDIVLMNTILGCEKPLSTYLDVRFKPDTILGPSNQVLSSTVKDVTRHPPKNQIGRLGLSYTVGDDGNVPFRFYVRRYLAYSNDLKTALASADNKNKWFVQQEFKNTTCIPEGPPRRLVIYLKTDGYGKPFYQLHMDQANSRGCDLGVDENGDAVVETDAVAEFPDIDCYAAVEGPCPALITGQWFYDEYFVQYSVNGSSNDRVAYYINGKKIFDHTGPIRSSKARGIKLTPGYLNIPNVEVRADDLEVYADFPCARLPCGPPSHY